MTTPGELANKPPAWRNPTTRKQLLRCLKVHLLTGHDKSPARVYSPVPNTNDKVAMRFEKEER